MDDEKRKDESADEEREEKVSIIVEEEPEKDNPPVKKDVEASGDVEDGPKNRKKKSKKQMVVRTAVFRTMVFANSDTNSRKLTALQKGSLLKAEETDKPNWIKVELKRSGGNVGVGYIQSDKVKRVN